MNRQRTHTVERSWRTEDRTTGEPCPEGSAVVVANDRAERPK